MTKNLYYTANDLKELYGLDQEMLRRLLVSGKLTECRYRRKTVFQKAEVMLLGPEDFLTAQEEKQLLYDINDRGPAFAKKRDQFIRLHYSLIHGIVNQYTGQGVDKDNLICCAIEELMDTIQGQGKVGDQRFSAVVSKRVHEALRDEISRRRPQPPKPSPAQNPPRPPARPPVPSPQRTPVQNHQEALDKLKSIQDLSPRRLFEKLKEIGYVGQDSARRKLCLMAYRHIRRLKDHYFKNVPLQSLPPKANVLMVGPTGCGKTHLTELLFGKIIGVPVTSIDITGFTETGYVGRHVSEILYELERAAKGNPEWAKMGICILDEFDKIASCGSAARFSGGGTTKDVSGYGVQRELLKLIEGGRHTVSAGGPFAPSSGKTMQTDHVGFVACGAFSGIKAMAAQNMTPAFGFNASANMEQDMTTAYRLDKEEIASVEVFARYGFMPELIGRFNSITALLPLDVETLTTILMRNVIPSYQQEFTREGLDFQIPQTVIDRIVNNAVSRKTGARGLALELTEYIEHQAFESFGNSNDAKSASAGDPSSEKIKLPAFDEMDVDEEYDDDFDNDIPF